METGWRERSFVCWGGIRITAEKPYSSLLTELWRNSLQFEACED